MMNVLAFSLVVSSLAAAGVWSPTPRSEGALVKEGRRVIVVEYDEDGKRNTKVSISSPPLQQQPKPGEYFGKETIKEAASALPNIGQGISPQGKAGPGRHSPGELICDAFGKCTHRIATVFGKAKDKVSETAHETKEKVKDKVAETVDEAKEKVKGKVAETAHEAKEKVSETAHEVKGKVAETTHEAKEKVSETAHEVKEKVSETAHEAKEKVASPKRWISHETKDKVAETARQTKGAVSDALGKAKEAAAQKGQGVKESAKESIDKAKDTIKTAKDTAKTIWDHIVSNVTEQVENAREKAMEEAKEAKENTERAARKVKTSANKFFDGLKYMTTMEALNSVMGMANLLGLATAYGMSVWVTFISSYVLAGVLPRQQFGVVQSKIYPVYFRAMAYSIGLALFGHFLGQRKTLFSSKSDMFHAFNLLSSLFMVLVNALYLEPKATKVMFERMKMEKEEGRGRDDFVAEGSRATEPPSVTNPAATKTREAPSPGATCSEQEVVKSRIARLNKRLKKLNTNSSLFNVLTLMALTWHLVYLGQRLCFNG
ncbi:hypothetical protein CRYUN_Cryun28dG0010700 [Craigia yunnanensis]